eukprot:403331951
MDSGEEQEFDGQIIKQKTNKFQEKPDNKLQNIPKSLNLSTERVVQKMKLYGDESNEKQKPEIKLNSRLFRANQQKNNISINFKKNDGLQQKSREGDETMKTALNLPTNSHQASIDGSFLETPVGGLNNKSNLKLPKHLPELNFNKKQFSVNSSNTPVENETLKQISIQNQKLISKKQSVNSSIEKGSYILQQPNVKHTGIMGSQKVKNLTLDRKDPTLLTHFSFVSIERKLNKGKLRDYLVKRYKEFMGERIMKYMMPFFNNFTIYHDLNQYCESIEAFANQDISMLRQFTFKIIDINNDRKLSENDMFQLMKYCSNKQSSQSGFKMPEQTDLFMEVFSGDVVKIVKHINLKKSGKLQDIKIRKFESKSSYQDQQDESYETIEEQSSFNKSNKYKKNQTLMNNQVCFNKIGWVQVWIDHFIKKKILIM